jgi:hypothetical protein
MEEKSLAAELKREFINWSASSTSHGFPNIFKNEKIALKTMWFIFLSLSAAFCGFMVARTILDYISFEVVSQIRVFDEIPAQFPTITICNLNPFVTNEAVALMSNNRFDRSIFRRVAANPPFGDENRKKLSYDMNKVMWSCEFNYEPCNSYNQGNDRIYEDFSWIYRIDLANCLRFNSGIDSKGKKIPIKSIYKEGEWSALYIDFILPDRANIQEYLYKRGIRIYVENSTYMHSTYSIGIDIKPGTFTEIILKKHITERLPYPYSDCQNSFPSEWAITKILEEKKYNYRGKDCSYICLQKEIIESCGCYDLWYDNYDTSVKPCFSEEQVTCANDLFKRLYKEGQSEYCSKMCRPECYSVSFETTYSLSDYPPRNYYDSLKSRPWINQFFASEGIRNFTFELAKERFLALKVYYNDLTYVKISEIEKFKVIDLIANIGMFSC